MSTMKPFDLHARVSGIAPSTILVREGAVPDAVYLLIHGRVRMMRGRVVVGWLTEGYAPFGLEALSGRRATHAYVSPPEQRIEVARVEPKDVSALCASLPQAAVRMFASLSARESVLVKAEEEARAAEETASRQWKLLSRIFEDLASASTDPGVSTLAAWIRKHPLNGGEPLAITDPLMETLPPQVKDLLVRLASQSLAEKTR